MFNITWKQDLHLYLKHFVLLLCFSELSKSREENESLVEEVGRLEKANGQLKSELERWSDLNIESSDLI